MKLQWPLLHRFHGPYRPTHHRHTPSHTHPRTTAIFSVENDRGCESQQPQKNRFTVYLNKIMCTQTNLYFFGFSPCIWKAIFQEDFRVLFKMSFVNCSQIPIFINWGCPLPNCKKQWNLLHHGYIWVKLQMGTLFLASVTNEQKTSILEWVSKCKIEAKCKEK